MLFLGGEIKGDENLEGRAGRWMGIEGLRD